MATVPPPHGPPGVLVVGHGTADASGAGETHCLAAGVAGALPGIAVELGFLEVIGPTVAEALERLAARGCREVVAAPLLLFTAGHARRDLPEAIAEPAARLGITVCQADALGCHPALVALSRRRRDEARAAAGADGRAEAVAFVVRGSSDPSTPPQAAAFLAASLALERVPPPAAVGFVAAARPTVAEALDGLAESARRAGGAWRVLVQPHLLFRGHVVERVAEEIDAARRRHPEIEWRAVERLGPDPAVVRAVIDRVLPGRAPPLPDA